MGKSPYQKVLMHGFVLDEHGNKMSKSLGNVVAPEEVIEKYGADVLRFYLLILLSLTCNLLSTPQQGAVWKNDNPHHAVFLCKIHQEFPFAFRMARRVP